MTHLDTAASTRELPGTGPLWSRLHADLQNRLAEGDFDDTFPGEMALVRQYGEPAHHPRSTARVTP